MADNGEISRQDVLPDDLIEAPLKMAKHFNILGVALDDVAAKAIKAGNAINASGSLSKIKKETDDLALAEKELLKIQGQVATAQAKNNEAYIAEANALAKTKQELKEKIALDGKEAQAVNAQNASLKQLQAALDANRKAYAQLANEEKRNSAEGVKLKGVIDQQDKSVKELNGSLGNFKDNVGNYKSGFAGVADSMHAIAPGAASAASGILGMVKASIAFIATPIGLVIAAIGAALYALTAYFRSSEEGQNRLNKIVSVGKAIFEQFMNVVEAVGEAIYDAISNPQQAIKDFGKLIKENIVNRFEGLIELIPQLGKAIGLLFKGEFTAAGKVALDATAKVAFGVENITDKISNAIDETKKLIDVGVKYGEEMARLQAKLDRDERKLIVNRAKTNLEVAKLREAAVTLEGDAKKKALTEAITLEQELSNKELAFATTAFELAKLKVKANGDDKEALKELAEAQAALYDAQKLAFDNTLKFRKQLEALDKKDNNDDALKERIRAAKEAAEREYLIKKEALDKNVALIKEEVVQGKKTKEEGDKEITALIKSQSDEQVQLIIDKVSRILEIEGLSNEDRLALEKELYKLKGELTDAYYDQATAKEKTWLEKNKENISKAQGYTNDFLTNIDGLANVMFDRKNARLDGELEALKDNYDKQIEAAGDNTRQKEIIERDFARKEKQLQDEKKKNQRKQAIFEKAINATRAVVNTAVAVTEVAPVIPLMVLVGALGALEVATILAQPIPAYAVGTDSAIGGPSLVGEKGTEMVVTPSGQLLFTPNRASIMNLQPGSQVYTHEETLNAMALSSLRPTDTQVERGSETEKEILQQLHKIRSNTGTKQTASSWLSSDGRTLFQHEKSQDGFVKISRARSMGRWLL